MHPNLLLLYLKSDKVTHYFDLGTGYITIWLLEMTIQNGNVKIWE